MADLAPDQRAVYDSAGGLKRLVESYTVTKHAMAFAAVSDADYDAGDMPIDPLETEITKARDVAAHKVLADLAQEEGKVLQAVGREVDGLVFGLREMAEKFISDNDTTVQTAEAYRYVARRFVELNGDLALMELELPHLHRFGVEVMKLPKSTRADIRPLQFFDAVKVADAEGLPRIGYKTRDKHINLLKSLMTETYLHRDQLSSVVLVANAAGGEDVERIFAPFGMQTEYVLNVTPDEDVGFIGERLDAVAGLQYLNARYYDPELGLFTQPDWLEVTEPGVGTNRYAYSFNDPVNNLDPSGNEAYVGSRDLDFPAGPGAHGFVAIITSDPSQYGKYEDSFQVMTNTSGKIPGIEKETDFYYMILSGDQTKNYDGLGPENNTLFGLTSQSADHASLRELASGKNHNGNWSSYSLDELEQLLDENGNGGTVLDQQILSAFSNYCNCAPYYFNPKDGSGTYNSNSFARAISERGGVANYPNNLPGLDLGSGAHISKAYFVGPRYLGE